MVDSNAVLAHIDVVACEDLTEREEADILRQERLMAVQREFLAALQADLDALKVMLGSVEAPRRERSVTENDRHISA